METTLNQIKKNDPCEDGWKKLLFYLGKTDADDEPLSIRTILESNGIEHAIWALRAVEGHNREIRLFAADCAESVLHIYEDAHPDDDRLRKAIEAARRYANGEIGEEELEEARRAAGAAWKAARTAAWKAAWYAAGAAGASWDAAGASWAAAGAAWDVAEAAWYAAGAARGAAGVAWAAELEKQKELLLKYI